MKIRTYAKQVGHEIIGRLTRRPAWEHTTEYVDGKAVQVRKDCRAYSDEAGNEYLTSAAGVCIITADGGVI